MASQPLWDGLHGRANHTRALLYEHGKYLVVVDLLETDRQRTVQATWHAHPNASVTFLNNGTAQLSGVPRGFLGIVPATRWSSHGVVQGHKPPAFPHFQGWYSASYLDCEAAPVVVYNSTIATGRTLHAWLLLPTLDPADIAAAAMVVLADEGSSVMVRVTTLGAADVVLRVPLVPEA